MQWNRDDDRARTEQQARLERECALIVQQLFPPSIDDELGEDHRRVVVGMLRAQLVEEGQQRARYFAVGRVETLLESSLRRTSNRSPRHQELSLVLVAFICANRRSGSSTSRTYAASSIGLRRHQHNTGSSWIG